MHKETGSTMSRLNPINPSPGPRPGDVRRNPTSSPCRDPPPTCGTSASDFVTPPSCQALSPRTRPPIFHLQGLGMQPQQDILPSESSQQTTARWDTSRKLSEHGTTHQNVPGELLAVRLHHRPVRTPGEGAPSTSRTRTPRGTRPQPGMRDTCVHGHWMGEHVTRTRTRLKDT